MADKIIKVSGMHCKSCETILETKISEIEGVRRVRAYTSRSEVKVQGSGFDEKTVEKAIADAGYRLGLEERTLFTRKSNIYSDIFTALLLAEGIYLAFKFFGVQNILPTISSSNYSYGVVAILGLTAGFSTCMALVGGLVLGFSTRYKEKHPEITGFKSFVPNIYFNLGRIVGFFILGGLLGELGTVVKVSSTANGWLLLIVSFVMLVVGLQLTEISPALSKVNFTMPRFITRLVPVRKWSKGSYNHYGAMTAGALTFFLPCGFTQAVQLVAIASGNFITGALLMMLFAIGTAPGLLAVGSLASVASGEKGKKLFRYAGVVVVLMALLNSNAALNLIGLSLPKFDLNTTERNQGTGTDQAVAMENGVQVVKMDVVQSGYSPNKFTVKKGVPVRWEVNVKDISTCASYLVAKDMGVQQLLRRGLNTFNFTPENVGTLRFTCSMGMYTGQFKVVE